MALLKKKRAVRPSYDLFSSYSHFIPGYGQIGVLTLLLVAGALIGSGVTGLMALLVSPEASLQYGMILSYPLMFIPPMIYASFQSRMREMDVQSLPLDNGTSGRLGMPILMILVSLLTLCMGFVSDPAVSLMPPMPENLKAVFDNLLKDCPIWVSILSVSIFAPLFEEWLCRGMVMRGLTRKTSPAAAIILSSLFFAIIHLNPWQAIPAFILGIVFGWIYYMTGSLKATMLMHCVNNSFALITSNLPGMETAEGWMDIFSPGMYAAVVLLATLSAFVIIWTIHKNIPEAALKRVSEDRTI